MNPFPDNNANNEEDDDSTLKWERMYAEGNNDDDIEIEVPDDKLSFSEVRVVTFDLDNTLWKTRFVIGAANDALASYLDKFNIHQPKRVEVIMGDLFKKNKEKYAPIVNKLRDASEDGTLTNIQVAPVYLTQLRKDSLILLCTEFNEYTPTAAEAFANDAFDVWTNARHAAIPLHFANDVVPTLKKIRSMKTAQNLPLIIGAITDGNSNPKNVPELRDFFDFCINAETIGISKPNRQVYETAIQLVAKMDGMQDIFSRKYDNELSQDEIEDIIGPWWVHVGDDFMKDIVASKGMNMRTVWTRELVLPEKDQTEKNNNTSDKSKMVKSKDVTEFVKELSRIETIKMNIGADDFLANSMEKEFADSVIFEFKQLYDVLKDWNNKATSNQNKMSGKLNVAEILANSNEEMRDIFDITLPDEGSKKVSNSVVPSNIETHPDVTLESKGKSDFKFCVYCGTKLTKVSNFCSSCGAKQPII